MDRFLQVDQADTDKFGFVCAAILALIRRHLAEVLPIKNIYDYLKVLDVSEIDKSIFALERGGLVERCRLTETVRIISINQLYSPDAITTNKLKRIGIDRKRLLELTNSFNSICETTKSNENFLLFVKDRTKPQLKLMTKNWKPKANTVKSLHSLGVTIDFLDYEGNLFKLSKIESHAESDNWDLWFFNTIKRAWKNYLESFDQLSDPVLLDNTWKPGSRVIAFLLNAGVKEVAILELALKFKEGRAGHFSKSWNKDFIHFVLFNRVLLN